VFVGVFGVGGVDLRAGLGEVGSHCCWLLVFLFDADDD
jgi:hypothetical protein